MERIHMNYINDIIHRLRCGESERQILRWFRSPDLNPNSSQRLALLAWLADHMSTRRLNPLTQPLPRWGEGQACALRWFRSPDLNPNSSQRLALLAWLGYHASTKVTGEYTPPFGKKPVGVPLAHQIDTFSVTCKFIQKTTSRITRIRL